ncbi:prenylated Rab acceptor protein 1-like [Argonauta hians]
MDEAHLLEGNIEVAENISTVTRQGKQSKMSLTLSSVTAREWFQKKRETIKPWGDFLNTSKFQVPKNLVEVPKHAMKNIEDFQSNYLFVFIGLVIVCILTSPLLLVALAACIGACYIIRLKNQEKKRVIMGHELSLGQQYAGVGVLSFPLFWVAGAGSAVFWVIGASFFLIGLHAVMYKRGEDEETFDLEMETV